MVKLKGLGRGLDALLATGNEVTPAGETLQNLAVTALQVLVAAAAVLPFAVAFEGVLPRVHFSPGGLVAYLFLVLGLTVGASLIWFWLLGRGEATRVTAWFFLVPILGIASCLLLMFSLPASNWWRLFAWLGLGLLIYFFYGRRHSVLGKELRGEITAHGVSPAGSLHGGPKHP